MWYDCAYRISLSVCVTLLLHSLLIFISPATWFMHIEWYWSVSNTQQSQPVHITYLTNMKRCIFNSRKKNWTTEFFVSASWPYFAWTIFVMFLYSLVGDGGMGGYVVRRVCDVIQGRQTIYDLLVYLVTFDLRLHLKVIYRSFNSFYMLNGASYNQSFHYETYNFGKSHTSYKIYPQNQYSNLVTFDFEWPFKIKFY